jgi:hypothetical protein
VLLVGLLGPLVQFVVEADLHVGGVRAPAAFVAVLVRVEFMEPLLDALVEPVAGVGALLVQADPVVGVPTVLLHGVAAPRASLLVIVLVVALQAAAVAVGLGVHLHVEQALVPLMVVVVVLVVDRGVLGVPGVLHVLGSMVVRVGDHAVFRRVGVAAGGALTAPSQMTVGAQAGLAADLGLDLLSRLRGEPHHQPGARILAGVCAVLEHLGEFGVGLGGGVLAGDLLGGPVGGGPQLPGGVEPTAEAVVEFDLVGLVARHRAVLDRHHLAQEAVDGGDPLAGGEVPVVLGPDRLGAHRLVPTGAAIAKTHGRLPTFTSSPPWDEPGQQVRAVRPGPPPGRPPGPSREETRPPRR